MGKLIKFAHVNTQGDFAGMLAHFGLDYSRKGDQIRLRCPFHDDSKPSLNITLVATETAQANTFHCFGCHESGSLIDFVAAMQGGGDLRAAAELIASISGCGLAPPRASKRAAKARRTKKSNATDGDEGAADTDVTAEAPESPPAAKSGEPGGNPVSGPKDAATGDSGGNPATYGVNPPLR